MRREGDFVRTELRKMEAFENRGGLNGGVGGLCEDRGPEERGE